jgi:putative acetyltransferase
METRTQARDMKVRLATSAADLKDIRALFTEYASSLEISLCFQHFEEELAGLPGKYAAPTGRLLLARDGAEAAGCVALRQLGKGISEMKRLFVRPRWRRAGLGRMLAEAIIGSAREIGYETMRLDTLASMQPAISLYRSLGFFQIPAYYDNPSENAVFMELRLILAPKTTRARPAGTSLV